MRICSLFLCFLGMWWSEEIRWVTLSYEHHNCLWSLERRKTQYIVFIEEGNNNMLKNLRAVEDSKIVKIARLQARIVKMQIKEYLLRKRP